MLYSAQTRGFYSVVIHGKNIPPDAREITGEQYAALLVAQSQGKYIEPDESGFPVAVEQPQPAPVDRRIDAKRGIDDAAGRARARYVSTGSLIDQEYLQAESAAQAFKASGGIVPPSVLSWAEASNVTPEAAADDILATAAEWRGVLDAVRDRRLRGKAAVDVCADADIETTAAGFVAELNAM